MKTLFLIALIVESIFGLGFIFAPGALLNPMGVTLTESAATFANLFGSAIISFPVLLFFAMKSDKIDFKNGVVRSMFVYFLISGILLFITQLNGQMNSLGWSIVVLHLIFIIWFGYFLLKKADS